MINREDWIMIKHLHAKGCYQRDIAAQLHISERTVRRALQRQGPPSRRRAGIRPSKLDAFKPLIDQLLSEQVWNAEVIFALIREQGYRGGISILRQYIQPKRALRRTRATVRFETRPGRQLQHDWGELYCMIGGERRKVYIAVNTLGYSRRFHAWASESQDAEHTYESLVQSFTHFGGVTAEVLVDNQKSAVLAHRPGGDITWNPGFVLLAEHYGFRPRACQPRRPQTKGKDERNVGYVKQNFFQRYRAFEDLEHLNSCLRQWLVEVADPRCHGTVKEVVIERFERERPALKPLPVIAFDTSYRDTRRVAMDGYVDVRGNRYSVRAHLCGDMVAIRITLSGELRIIDAQDRLVATHRLVASHSGWQTVPAHHARLWQETLRVQTRDLKSYEGVA
jgi:transposase